MGEGRSSALLPDRHRHTKGQQAGSHHTKDPGWLVQGSGKWEAGLWASIPAAAKQQGRGAAGGQQEAGQQEAGQQEAGQQEAGQQEAGQREAGL